MKSQIQKRNGTEKEKRTRLGNFKTRIDVDDKDALRQEWAFFEAPKPMTFIFFS
jgi:hypothetical protein